MVKHYVLECFDKPVLAYSELFETGVRVGHEQARENELNRGVKAHSICR